MSLFLNPIPYLNNTVGRTHSRASIITRSVAAASHAPAPSRLSSSPCNPPASTARCASSTSPRGSLQVIPIAVRLDLQACMQMCNSQYNSRKTQFEQHIRFDALVSSSWPLTETWTTGNSTEFWRGFTFFTLKAGRSCIRLCTAPNPTE
jgi:hypothetical protein